MEDFAIDFGKKSKSSEDKLDMSVSALCPKNGEKVAYVTFSDGKRLAEGEIPACRILSNNGFTEGEVSKLEEFMKRNLDMIKTMASAINPIKAMMK